jgi:hypothetical protein
MKTEIFERLKSEAYQSLNWESMDSDTLLERVVELTVKECARICYDEDFVSGSGYAQEITKRFGVEE